MLKNEWRQVVGYEGVYEVSSSGLVRRTAGSPRCPNGRLRKLVPRNGYMQIVLSARNAVSLQWVHRLVAFAFLGPPKPGQMVNHIDGNGSNNNVSNLEWATMRENSAHAYRIGLRLPSPSLGSRNGWSKLTEADVAAIRSSADSALVLSRRFGICRTHVYRLRSRSAWAHC